MVEEVESRIGIEERRKRTANVAQGFIEVDVVGDDGGQRNSGMLVAVILNSCGFEKFTPPVEVLTCLDKKKITHYCMIRSLPISISF